MSIYQRILKKTSFKILPTPQLYFYYIVRLCNNAIAESNFKISLKISVTICHSCEQLKLCSIQTANFIISMMLSYQIKGHIALKAIA